MVQCGSDPRLAPLLEGSRGEELCFGLRPKQRLWFSFSRVLGKLRSFSHLCNLHNIVQAEYCKFWHRKLVKIHSLSNFVGWIPKVFFFSFCYEGQGGFSFFVMISPAIVMSPPTNPERQLRTQLFSFLQCFLPYFFDSSFVILLSTKQNRH